MPACFSLMVVVFLVVWVTGVLYFVLTPQQPGAGAEEELSRDVLEEVLREAAEHPEEKGEREEWSMKTGVGRKDSVFSYAKIVMSKKKSLRGAAASTITSEIISRDDRVTVTCDTRGNLGPCSVVNQVHPGTNWLKDRWQAASDMGGTAIPGHHWITLDFKDKFYFDEVVLDWEAAHAKDYRIEGRNGIDGQDDDWVVLYDGSVPPHKEIAGQRTTREEGQSPGVKTKTPLHVIHTILLNQDHLTSRSAFRFLRVYILRPARGWGVSLWRVDVIGHRVP